MPRRPGAVRSEEARLAILAAAARQFTELGYDHLTIEGVAAEAGVGKQTIYRWWSSKTALITECLVEGMLIPLPIEPLHFDDLESWVGAILSFVPGNESLVRSLVIAAAEDENLARSLNERLGILPLAGDKNPQFPLELIEALVGVIVVRALRRGPVDAELAQRLIALVRSTQP